MIEMLRQLLKVTHVRDPHLKYRSLIALVLVWSLFGCGGGSNALAVSEVGTSSGTSVESPVANPLIRVLEKPVLSFTDTGLSVTDGVTRIGAWEVSTLEGWEYSFDRGVSWIQGVGDNFDVQGDGAKTIWVRARDELGNTSDIVMVSCVLDTMPPAPLQTEIENQDQTRLVRVMGLEPQSRWEYSVDEQRSWWPGTGDRLAVMGNAVSVLSLRQVDQAGNLSSVETVNLQESGNPTWHEASNNPIQPSVLSLQQARTVLLHGSVVRGDADYVRWEVPAGLRLRSMRLVHYVSADPLAFFAMQRSAVFDAGIDVSRMMVYGHMGPQDLKRNVVENVMPEQLRAGFMTLWFQQTGPQATDYAIALEFEPAS
jgi:hypothetical protein